MNIKVTPVLDTDFVLVFRKDTPHGKAKVLRYGVGVFKKVIAVVTHSFTTPGITEVAPCLHYDAVIEHDVFQLLSMLIPLAPRMEIVETVFYITPVVIIPPKIALVAVYRLGIAQTVKVFGNLLVKHRV